MVIMAIAPHTDDIELGCGATIHKLIRVYGENNIICVAMSHLFAHPITNKRVDLKDEWISSCEILGVKHVHSYSFNVRNFDKVRQDILQEFIELKKTYNPDVVIIPCTKDVHQDHQVVTAEAIRAFRDCTILGYILPWNILEDITPNCFVEVFDNDVQNKIKAFKKFESQVSRSYSSKIEAAAIFTGTYIGKPYAEGFESIRIKSLL